MKENLPKPNNVRSPENNDFQRCRLFINPIKIMCLLHIIFHSINSYISYTYPDVVIFYFFNRPPIVDYFKIIQLYAFYEMLSIVLYIQIIFQFQIINSKKILFSLLINDCAKLFILLYFSKGNHASIIIAGITASSIIEKMYLVASPKR